METLPPEITFDILSRLPVESLAQAKYVSKLWNSIINNPSFATAHFSHQNNNKPSLLLHCMSYRTNTTSDLFLLDPNDPEPHLLPLRFHLSNLKVYPLAVSSTNGILCIEGPTYGGLPTPHLCNPVLDEHLTILPNSNWPRNCRYTCFFDLAHDHSTGDYKLLIFYKSSMKVADGGSEVVLTSEVCTVSSNRNWNRKDDASFTVVSWRPLGRPPCLLSYSKGCFLNGRLHWLVHINGEGSDCIVSFDVHNEVFGVLSDIGAFDSGNSKMLLRIGVLGECISLFNGYSAGCLDVWVMKEYGKKESWVKQYSITTSSFKGCREATYYYPLCLLEVGKILIWSSFDEFLCYDPTKDIICEFKVQGNHYRPKHSFVPTITFAHTCSIVSLKAM